MKALQILAWILAAAGLWTQDARLAYLVAGVLIAHALLTHERPARQDEQAPTKTPEHGSRS